MHHDEEVDATVVVLALLRLGSCCHLSDLIEGFHIDLFEDNGLELLHRFEIS
jgi:hypothetical protein